MKRAWIITLAMVTAGIAQADLAFTNGDFEAQTVGTDSGNRSHAITGWYESATAWNAWAEELRNRTEVGSEYATFSTISGFLYQSLGVKSGEDAFQITGTAVRTDGTMWADLNIELFAGAFAGAAEGTDIAGQGLQQLGTYTIQGDGTVLDTSGYGSVWQGNTETLSFTTGSFDLSGVADGTEIWVRMSAAESVASMGPGVDDLTVIPEPATLGLLSAFGGAIVFIRRRIMM